MKTLIFILLFIQSICFAFNPFDNLDIPADKVLHFQTSYLLCDYMQDGLKLDNWQVFYGITTLFLLKEYADSQTGGTWDNTDILANYAGWATRRIFVVKLTF